MIRSNIQGLGKLLQKFEDRIKNLERNSISTIEGGENIRINKAGNKAIINADPAGDSSAPVVTTQCDFVFSKFDIVVPDPDPNTGQPSTDPTTFKIKSTGGTLNGLLPANFQSIGEFDDQTDAFVTLDATVDTSGVTTLQYTKRSSIPDIEPQYSVGAPPSNLQFFAFMVIGGKITSSLCSNLFASPEVAYLDQTVQPYQNICTWNITSV